MKKAITLTELMIAISLMGVVILGAVAFDSASRRLMGSSERKTAVLNELSLIADYFHRDGSLCSGGTDLDACYRRGPSPAGVLNVCMMQDVNTPWLYSDDALLTYIFDTNNHTIMRNGETISNRFMTTAGNLNNSVSNDSVTVWPIVLRYNPALGADDSTNPEISGNIAAFCTGGPGL